MQLNSPVNILASSFYHAIHVGFSEFQHETYDYESMRGMTAEKRNANPIIKIVSSRPHEYNSEIYAMFKQTWGSTALGFGGIGGAAMTPSYTVVVYCQNTGEYLVYWSGQYGYTVGPSSTDDQKETFFDDVRTNHTCSRRDAPQKYGAFVKEC